MEPSARELTLDAPRLIADVRRIMQTVKSHQVPLLQALYAIAGLELDATTLLVEPLDDGGMGSHRLNSASRDSIFGREAAELQFLDSDGVLVMASLYVDQHGHPFELDVWKVDYSPLVRWPEAGDVKASAP